MSDEHAARPFAARTIRRFSVPIILAWVAIVVIVDLGVPSLERVEKEHSVSLNAPDAPSFTAMTRVNHDFQESTSGSLAMIVLEGQQPLGGEAHEYYDRLIRQLDDDPKHVLHVQNFWGDPLTAGAAQSVDGKAVYVQLNLAGKPGETLWNGRRRPLGSRSKSPALRRSFLIWARVAIARSSR
jgi:putative drug exporter of the RND superfamily